jgi:predicted Holliday junction resolvase-like endonuclease
MIISLIVILFVLIIGLSIKFNSLIKKLDIDQVKLDIKIVDEILKRESLEKDLNKYKEKTTSKINEFEGRVRRTFQENNIEYSTGITPISGSTLNSGNTKNNK